MLCAQLRKFTIVRGIPRFSCIWCSTEIPAETIENSMSDTFGFIPEVVSIRMNLFIIRMIQTILLISFARFCHRGYEDKPPQNLRFPFRFESHIRLSNLFKLLSTIYSQNFTRSCHAVYYGVVRYHVSIYSLNFLKQLPPQPKNLHAILSYNVWLQTIANFDIFILPRTLRLSHVLRKPLSTQFYKIPFVMLS